MRDEKLVGGNCLGKSANITELAVEGKKIVRLGGRNRLNEMFAYHDSPRAKGFTVIDSLLRLHDDLESITESRSIDHQPNFPWSMQPDLDPLQPPKHKSEPRSLVETSSKKLLAKDVAEGGNHSAYLTILQCNNPTTTVKMIRPMEQCTDISSKGQASRRTPTVYRACAVDKAARFDAGTLMHDVEACAHDIAPSVPQDNLPPITANHFRTDCIDHLSASDLRT